MSKKVYTTQVWRKFRDKILVKKGIKEPFCKYCGSIKGITLNHLVYTDTIFDEDPDHYEVVCRKCHYGYHFYEYHQKKIDFKKAWDLK